MAQASHWGENAVFLIVSFVALAVLFYANSKVVLVNISNTTPKEAVFVFSSETDTGEDTSRKGLRSVTQKPIIEVATLGPTLFHLFKTTVQSLNRPLQETVNRNQKVLIKPTQSLLRSVVSVVKSVSEGTHTSSSHDVTFTSQGTTIRYYYFPILLKRWKGPMSITLCLKPDEVESITNRLKSDNFDSRLSIVQYIAQDPNVYPINKLRNLAIANVKTNHFWLTDLDMWPSDGLYQAILDLPPSALNDEKLAIIVPAFEIHATSCPSFEECTNQITPIFPATKASLVQCMRTRKCSTFRPWDQLHDYHFSKWYLDSYTTPLTPVTCFKGNTQEPYVVVKKSSFLPSFDERFINYAYNKVQWLEHLRYRGYAFSIITNGFAVDVPHPFSALRKRFMNVRETTKQTLNKGMYDNFLAELRRNETDRSVVKYC